MGNHRFRLSDMMPNAWFYRLKDMSRTTTTATATSTAKKRSSAIHPSSQTHKEVKCCITPSRASYYFPSNSPLHPKALDTHFPLDSPRKSGCRPRRNPVSPRPISSACSSRNSTSESETTPKSLRFDQSDIVFDAVADHNLPPILTKPDEAKEKECKHAAQAGIQRLRVRAATTPRVKVSVAQRGASGTRRRKGGLSESFAVVKSSSDPRRDFRESMMEMITENNLRSSKDLEELLACYLSLNSNDYHDVIVKVFEEIWFDITDSIRVL